MDVCKSMRNYSEKFGITQMRWWVKGSFVGVGRFFFENALDPYVPFFFAHAKKNRTGRVFYAISKHRIKRKYEAALASL